MANSSSNDSPPGAENFILPTIAFIAVLGALFFVIGYASMADFKRGALQAWNLSAIVRAAPVMITLGILHVTFVRRRMGVATSVCYALVIVGLLAFVGPERAPVVGYCTLIPLAMLKASGDWHALSRFDRILYLGVLCAFWFVIVFGAVAGFVNFFPSWEGAEFLRASLGMVLMPVAHTSLLFTIIISAVTLVTLVGIGGLASSDDFTRIAVLVAPFLFGGLCCIVFCWALIGGYPIEVPKIVMFGMARVLFVALAGIALLGGPNQRNWRDLFKAKVPPVIAQNKLAFLGLIAMIALEVANGFGLLSLTA